MDTIIKSSKKILYFTLQNISDIKNKKNVRFKVVKTDDFLRIILLKFDTDIARLWLPWAMDLYTFHIKRYPILQLYGLLTTTYQNTPLSSP